MSHRKFTDPQEAEMAGLYRDGWSYPRLAHQYNTSVTVIKWAMRRQGVTPRHCGRYSYVVPESLVSEIRKRYVGGDSQLKIAHDLGLTQTRISRAIHKIGIAKPHRQNRDGHGNWKGGKSRSTTGYIVVLLDSDSPYFCMTNSAGYVLEHRLIMAQHLNRPLEGHETVHHINGNITDNHLENLQLRNSGHGKGKVLKCLDCGSTNIVAMYLE